MFLSTLPATRRDRTVALAIVGVSSLLFMLAVPFADLPLPQVPAFVASYHSALAVSDLITAMLLFSQFVILRSRSLLWLASGYLFTAAAATLHALTFPGLFAPVGLFGAGSQTSEWLYVFWHGAFPLFVLAYALTKSEDGGPNIGGQTTNAILGSVLAIATAMVVVAWIVTARHDLLPILLSGDRYTPTMTGVASLVWFLSLSALIALLQRRPQSVIDVWLMVVMCAWLFDVALSAIVNVARFDLGFYAGRIYGLCAANVVLAILLIENAALHTEATHLVQVLRWRAASARDLHTERERLFSAVVESSNDAIITKSLDGTITAWNRAAERLFRYSAPEAVGRRIDILVPEERRMELDDILARIRRGEMIAQHETVRVRQDGRELNVLLSISPLRSASGEIIGAAEITRDITEKRAEEAQLRHAQKMDAVGQLTGGVAHDFNNILTVITGTIGILTDAVADRPELVSIAKLIDDAAERGAQLTKHLLAFARRQPLQPREVDVNTLVLETARLLRPTLGEHVTISVQLADDVWLALVDPNQLTTAILNLALNARDAMPDGGKLVLETRNVHLDDGHTGMKSDVVVGNYVMIAVSDTGTGIPAEHLEKVFDPFFTTKEVGKGTGLGLSMVFGFVKQSGGHVKIYSEEGHGTSLKLYLPRSTGVQESEVGAMQFPTVEGGDETILVVEDDALVRQYVMAQILSLGYTALEAADATEALNIIDGGADVDLLFTDVIMPGPMNGRQLADEALKRRPALKTLFTSGYTENAIVHYGRLDSGVLLLAKPYRKSELARMIRVALAS
ncbi:MAG: MASE4 domain-containing protein [Bradyrhizobium sp.]|uniref:MASE4 domain-containing protein n=1 Tax=Bradyrhizobium sp. TaxID=376 RepID=UPI0025B85F04|nr:MASE4 domain-containing protein [Bradyrhizobium sp.]MBI5265334.1 MASE4 domain-containing protein [Bradyrhizobium sp.]